jgi:hypothetical protein
MTLEFNIRYKVTAKAEKREIQACGAGSYRALCALASGIGGGKVLRSADCNDT